VIGKDKGARHERAAVAYARRFDTNAGLIWREITGQDIGIDAIVELPYSDGEAHSVRGFALLQVKSRANAVFSEELSATYKERHHLYWLTQRLPVLLCVVEPSDSDEFSTGRVGHWIDYKSLKPEDYSISTIRDGRWTLRVPLRGSCVWSPKDPKQSDWSSEAREFRDWFESALVRSAEAIVSTLWETRCLSGSRT
jgi:hypothetical protein